MVQYRCSHFTLVVRLGYSVVTFNNVSFNTLKRKTCSVAKPDSCIVYNRYRHRRLNWAIPEKSDITLQDTLTYNLFRTVASDLFSDLKQ